MSAADWWVERADLDGRVAILTGGAGGLGEMMTLDLQANGCKVAVVDRDTEAIEALTAELTRRGADFIVHVGDAREPEVLDALFDATAQRWGLLDILVNVVGGTFRAPFEGSTPKAWDTLLRTNLTHVLHATSRAIPAIKAGGRGGSIISITTIEGYRAAPNFAVYSAAKAAVAQFTRSLSLELAPDGIRVNCVAPDLAPTPGMKKIGAGVENSMNYPLGQQVAIPMGRAGTMTDISDVVVFLASGLSKYITGSTLHPDGGTFTSSGWFNWPESGYGNTLPMDVMRYLEQRVRVTAVPVRDELRFDGRTAVVTGAGAGLGRSHASLLAARGAKVVVNDVHGETANAVVAEIEAAGGTALPHAADISQPDGAAGLVQTVLDAWGRIDVVVNNAGLLQPTDFADMTVEIFDRAYAVNLRASFLVTHAAWTPMVQQGYGRVVHTSSNSGLLGIAGSTGYASAKAGLWGFTRSLSLEAAPLGIHVNAIGPIAYTAMARTSRVAPDSWKSGEGDAWSRRLDVAFVSPAVAWLAHEDCTLNGQVLSAAAGRVARFVMGLNHGFVSDTLTIEDVRDHDELLQTEPPDEFPTTANDESIALHRRVMPRAPQPTTPGK